MQCSVKAQLVSDSVTVGLEIGIMVFSCRSILKLKFDTYLLVVVLRIKAGKEKRLQDKKKDSMRKKERSRRDFD